MSTDNGWPDRLSAAERARRLARSTARKMAVEDGSATMTRPLYADSQTEIEDVEPLAGFRAAHDLELGARFVAHSYITAAREAGATWHDIGTAMGVRPRKDAEHAGWSAAEFAYQYATQSTDPDYSQYDMYFQWNCPSCDGLVYDDGPYGSPSASERGHANGCERFARAQADREATD
jgi:hypothetical protein